MSQGNIRLLIAGDVGIKRPDPKSIFAAVADTMRSADITLVNQEWVLSDRGEPWPGKAGKMIGSSPDAVEALLLAGVDVVGLANNHMMNYGPEAMFQTIEILDRAGIAHAGAGANLAEAHTPAIVERNGVRVGVLSYTSVFTKGWEATPDRPGLATVRVEASYTPYYRADEMPGSPYDFETQPDPKDKAQLEADIRAARPQVDFLIITWHWGVSMGYQHLVPYQKELGHFVLDAGADLVVGHHPHTLQPIEIYNGKPICYSLAQFGFDLEALPSDETLLVECELRGGTLERFFIHPAVSLPNGDVRLVRGQEATRVVEWVRRLCKPFGTQLTPAGDRLEIALRTPAAV
jgi:poly-gamma-glutamate capsule biosynthesis protein CapA/YwtB (metallophosphatase superfamily)